MSDTSISWAPRASQLRIRQLYEAEARGLLDDELLEDVGISLYARCESILALTDAYRGKVHCPRCGAIVEMVLEGRGNDTAIACSCGWRTTWLGYKKTTGRDKRMRAGNAERAFEAFVRSYRTARTQREKMLLIDSLLHEFHKSRKGESGPAAVNVIEGSRDSIVDMLNDLFSAENRASRDAVWRRRMAESLYGRRRYSTADDGTGDRT